MEIIPGDFMKSYYLNYSTNTGGWQGLVAVTQAPDIQTAMNQFYKAFNNVWFLRFSISYDEGYLQKMLGFPLEPEQVGILPEDKYLPPELYQALTGCYLPF